MAESTDSSPPEKDSEHREMSSRGAPTVTTTHDSPPVTTASAADADDTCATSMARHLAAKRPVGERASVDGAAATVDREMSANTRRIMTSARRPATDRRHDDDDDDETSPLMPSQWSGGGGAHAGGYSGDDDVSAWTWRSFECKYAGGGHSAMECVHTAMKIVRNMLFSPTHPSPHHPISRNIKLSKNN